MVRNATPAVLGRVLYLKYVDCLGNAEPEEWTRHLESLHSLVELRVKDICDAREDDEQDLPMEPSPWPRVAAAWSADTAPALRQLHVHCRHERHGSHGLPSLALRLKSLQPALRFCSGPACPDKYPRDN